LVTTNGPTATGVNNDGYNPLERLDKIRRIFFPRPGLTLGENQVPVWPESRSGYPENVRYRRAGVSFAAVHVVGSNPLGSQSQSVRGGQL
jgi:hypothetical protein